MRLVAAVVALVVLAGCSAAVPGAGGGERTGTVTPAPLPEASATPTGGVLAPGVTRQGVTDPLALANAHAAGIDRQSYALYTRWTVRYANGSLRGELLQRARVSPEGSFYANVSVRGRTGIVSHDPTVAEFWSDSEELVERARVDDTVRYLYIPSDEFSGGNGFYNSLRRPKPWRDTYALFDSVDTRVVGRQTGPGGEGTVYLLEGTELLDPAVFGAVTDTRNPRNVTLTAAVSDVGIVRGYRVEYDARFRGDAIRVTRVVRYRSLGDVTVERPDWYGTARNRSVRGSRGSDPAPGLGPEWTPPGGDGRSSR